VSERPAFLDVNVPMYAAGRPHLYKEACVWVMREVALGRLAVAADVEIVQEILYRYGALQRRDIAVVLARSVLEIVPVVHPIGLAEMSLAVDLFERYSSRGLSARDVIHLAVMQTHDLKEIISVDRHFDGIEGVRRLDPLVLWQRADK
jgi:predicted nucleic acid-binding protein